MGGCILKFRIPPLSTIDKKKFVQLKYPQYICIIMENNITITLTKEEYDTLKTILFYWVDQVEYDVEQTMKDNDPNGELEELTDNLLVSMSINKKLQLSE